MSPMKTSALEVPRIRFELACGAQLLVSPRPGAPVTAARFHVRGGSALDPEGKDGLAYLTGRLTDQGTPGRGEADFAAEIEPAGGEISGSSSGLTGSIAGDSWKLLLELMGELFTGASYPTQAVLAQRSRLVDRLSIQEDDPRTQGARLFRELVYGDHYLGRSHYGTATSVANIAPKDLRSHRKKNWTGKRLWISICGDVDPLKVRRHLDKVLSGLKPGSVYQAQDSSFPKLGRRTAAFTRDREQAHVYLGHLGVRRKTPDWAAIVVMDHVLGSGPGFTNRISRILRDEQGLAYSVHADLHGSAGLLPGAFTAYIGTSPQNVGTAVAGFRSEIHRIQDELVPKDELEMAKDYLIGSFPMGYERASRRAAYLIGAEIHKHPEDHLLRLPKDYAAVTSADVRAAAKAHLHPDNCCLAAAGPVSAKELKKLLS